MRFGKWEFIKKSSVLALIASLTLISNHSTKAEVPDVGASEFRKTVQWKKHLRVVKVVKDSEAATTITYRILKREVSLTIGELFVSAPAFEKQLTKAMS